MSLKYYRHIKSAGWQCSTPITARSKTQRKIMGLLCGFRDRAIIDHNHAEKTITHMFRADPTNCGDWWSMPARYFTFPRHDNVADINDYERETPLSGTVILGGGDLIGPAFSQVEALLENPDIQGVGWGLGDNMIDDKRSGYVSAYADLPPYVKNFRLLGIRDVIDGLRWVPCASCMHPIFSEDHERTHDIVVFEHKRIPLKIEGIPKMTNNGNDIEKIVRFIASGDTVVTNSYHGAYWATLLGRKCITIPFSSKFLRMKHAPVLSHQTEWKAHISKARTYDDALSESRMANIKFYADVMDAVI